MKVRAWFILTLAMLFVASVAMASSPEMQRRTSVQTDNAQTPAREIDEIVWSEDFEGDVSDWTQTSPDVQPDYWQTDTWMPNSGANSWRCFDYGFGDPSTGGYADDWLQFMFTPSLDFSGATAAELTFEFRAYIEGDGGVGWDGANVWVIYGNDPENLAKVIANPTSPAYTYPFSEAFEIWFGPMLPAYPIWEGEGDQPFCTTYVTATFDLSMYTGYTYVFVAFAFSSDTAYNSGDNTDMYGFQVDDIVITADATTVWADDADGGNIGGPPSFLTGAAAAGLPVLPFQVEIADVGIWGPAPSPTHVAGVFEDIDEAFSHYLEGPEFNLEVLDPGESYWLDLMFNSDIEYTNNFPDEFVWRPEIWNPVTNGWVAAATTGNYVYVGGNGSIWEPFSTSGFTYDWDMSEYSGMDGVRLRIYFSAPSVPRTMTHHLVDDMTVELMSLQHDISTMLNMPYPTSVGADVYGKVVLTNNGPNQESGFSAVWDLGGMIFPLLPAAPYTIPAGETLELSINDPTDPDHDGYWVPTTMGLVTINAYHTLGTDEVPENNAFPVDVDVFAEGSFEIGTDSRNYGGLLSAGHVQDEGPTVHIDPFVVNPSYFPLGTTFDFTELRMEAFFHSAAGGAPVNCSMDFLVYAGGETPGAVLYQGTYTFTETAGYVGDTQAILDVSGVAALQEIGGDFWIEARLTTPGTGGYMQPFPYQTGANDFQDTQFYTYANAQAGSPLVAYGHHVTAVVTNVLSVEDLTGNVLPAEFALGSAYPNPFNPSTTISFNVAQPGNVSLIVYNVTGQEVARIVDNEFQAGSYNATFNAATLSSGVYFVRMEATGFNATQKIMLMK